MSGYQEFAFSGKEVTKGDSIGEGQIELRHLSPGLFQEIQKIATHKHSGTDSNALATPSKIKVNGDVESIIQVGSNASSAAGAVTVTFTVPFTVAPKVIISKGSAAGSVFAAAEAFSITTTQFQFNAYDMGGARVAVECSWIAIGQ